MNKRARALVLSLLLVLPALVDAQVQVVGGGGSSKESVATVPWEPEPGPGVVSTPRPGQWWPMEWQNPMLTRPPRDVVREDDACAEESRALENWLSNLTRGIADLAAAPLQCAIDLCQLPDRISTKKTSVGQLCRMPLGHMVPRVPAEVPAQHISITVDRQRASRWCTRYSNFIPRIDSPESRERLRAEDYSSTVVVTGVECNRPNDDCWDLAIPENQDEDEFAARLQCMMFDMETFVRDNSYDVMSGNCGGTAAMLAECAGGFVRNETRLNLGIGCGWKNRKFRVNDSQFPNVTFVPPPPGELYPSHEHSVTGEQLCDFLRARCVVFACL